VWEGDVTTASEFPAEEILSFWFEELTPKDWFSGAADVDRAIRERFVTVCRSALASPLPEEYLDSPSTALAGVIVLDQFPRNIFRGTAEAFSGDQSAIAITHGAMTRKYDERLPAVQKQFLYMPLMHSEVLADQELSVKVFGDIGEPEALKYAIEHRDIIAQFGRFPHRNRVLGRQSTPEELRFMESHKGYGQ
jgi:uncharacterized protein (DUF924 family)